MTDIPAYYVNDSWLRAVEHLVLPALENKVRVLGFTAPRVGAGVTTLSVSAAETVARSGTKVLLIDFSTPVPAQNGAHDSQAGVWVPGEGGAQAFVRRDASGFDVLTAVPTVETRYIFNNGKRLRRTLFEDLSDYAVIIVDLPPLLEERPDVINSLAVAMACDQVLMICAKNQTTRADAANAADAARLAGVKLAGVVWNQFGVPKLGVAMAETVRRRLGFIPPLARYLENRLRRSPFLNS